MNKKTFLWILLDLVIITVFNVLFFALGGKEHPSAVWIAYGFIHFAYVMMVITPLLIRRSSSSTIFGLSIGSISITYFYVELIAGLIFIAFLQDNIRVSLAVQVVIAGIYAMVLIAHLIANESTADNIDRHENETAYIKHIASRVKTLQSITDDKAICEALEKVYDILHSSPAKSNDAVKTLEAEMVNAVSVLEGIVMNGDKSNIIAAADQVISLAEERNRELKKLN